MTDVDLTGARKVAAFAPDLLQSTEHHLCPGCGHPVAWRLLVEVLAELELVDRSIGVVGHGCYTQIITTADVEFLQCLHGRAPGRGDRREAHAARTARSTRSRVTATWCRRDSPRCCTRRRAASRSRASCSTTACSVTPAGR